MGNKLGSAEMVLRSRPDGRIPQSEGVALSLWLAQTGHTMLTPRETELYRLARYYGWRQGRVEVNQGRFSGDGNHPLYPVVSDRVLDALRDGPKTSREVWEQMQDMTPHNVRVKIHQLKASGRIAIAVEAKDNFGKAIYTLGPKARVRVKTGAKRGR